MRKLGQRLKCLHIEVIVLQACNQSVLLKCSVLVFGVLLKCSVIEEAYVIDVQINFSKEAVPRLGYIEE